MNDCAEHFRFFFGRNKQNIYAALNRLGISEYQKTVRIFEEKLENQLSNLIRVWRIRKKSFPSW